MKSIETPILICGIGGYRNDSRRVRRNRASSALKLTGASTNDRGGRRRFTPAFHGAIALRVFSTRRHRPLGAAVASAAARGVGPASRPSVSQSGHRQPGSFRLDPPLAAGRAKGASRGSGPARRSRCSRSCFSTTGSSRLAITFIAPPPCSQGSISILNTCFKRCA